MWSVVAKVCKTFHCRPIVTHFIWLLINKENFWLKFVFLMLVSLPLLLTCIYIMQCNVMFWKIYFGKAIGIHFGTLSLQWYKKITVQPAKEIQQVTAFIYTFLKLKVLSGHMSCPQHFSVRLDLNARLTSWHRETP